MKTEVAPGVPADWLNGWLASVGITVLLPDVKLSWTDDSIPLAVFHYVDAAPLAEQITAALPSESELERLCLSALPRNVTLEAFRAAAARSRAEHDHSLAMSLTDLVSGKRYRESELPHGAFDPPMPHGITLPQRAGACRRLLARDSAKRFAETLGGVAVREKVNGLGFDIRRIPAGVQPAADVMADPAIECLCFVALTLFPVRGDGRRASQRGWDRPSTQRGVFTWPAWCEPLDVWGVDALLDRFYANPTEQVRRLLGIVASFASVAYQSSGGSDVTRGYGSRRIT